MSMNALSDIKCEAQPSDKARIASVLNSFKNDPFYTDLVTLFTKEVFNIDVV